MKPRNLLVALIAALVALSGCAPKAAPTPVIVFPLPPDEPRVAYVRSYRGVDDFKSRSFLDILFGAPPDSGLEKPYGVFASHGTIYAALTGRGPVIVQDTVGRSVSFVGAGGVGRLSMALGVAAAEDGTIYVSDGSLGRLYAYNKRGGFEASIGDKDLKRPVGVAINEPLSRIYVADSYHNAVFVFSRDGTRLFSFGRKGREDGEFFNPTSVAIDRRNGTVYVTDTHNFRVQAFDPDGKFLRTFGHLGDYPGSFSRPKGVGVDSEGHVYVVDAGFSNIQVFSEKGELLLYFGSLGSGPAEMVLPAGLYVDEEDRIYVADSLNSRIQVFQYLSENWKKKHPEEYEKLRWHPAPAATPGPGPDDAGAPMP